MKRTKDNAPRQVFPDFPWMAPANEIRGSAEYAKRRQELVAALRSAKRLVETRKFKVADWNQYLWKIAGPAPAEDADAAGRPRNRQWWLYYRLCCDADEIRREAFKARVDDESN